MVSSPSALGRCFLGLLYLYDSLMYKYGFMYLFMYRFMSFLWMKPDLFLILNHFTILDTFVTMTFLSLPVGPHSLHPAHRATLGGGTAAQGHNAGTGARGQLWQPQLLTGDDDDEVAIVGLCSRFSGLLSTPHGAPICFCCCCCFFTPWSGSDFLSKLYRTRDDSMALRHSS